MIGCHAGGTSAMYFEIGSSSFSLPRSCKSRMAAAVNCLVTEPSLNRVRGEFGTPHSMLAFPNPLLNRTCPPRAISTAPMNSPFDTRVSSTFSTREKSLRAAQAGWVAAISRATAPSAPGNCMAVLRIFSAAPFAISI